MKKVWFAVGAVIIIILLLLQTRFNIFMQLDNEGYAIKTNTVKSALLVNAEEELNTEGIDLYQFNSLDYIYSRAGSYYLGDEKKTAIDMSFPLYVNGGAGLYFTDNSGALFDVSYDEYSVYQRLTVNNGGTYNPDGNRAHPMDFLFYGTQSGFYYNLMDMQIIKGDKTRSLYTNSIINFTEDTLTFCEFQGGQMVFGRIPEMSPNDMVNINDTEITYHELLIKLGIISDTKKNIGEAAGVEEPEIIVPEPELQDEDKLTEQDNNDDLKEKKTDEKEKKEHEKKVNESQRNTPATRTSSPASSSGSRSSSSGAGGSKGSSAAGPADRGVRPDSARPDKDKKPTKPRVPDYEKPIVTVNSVTSGIYRIMLNVTVKDNAQRIDKLKRVQFDFYEVSSSGKEKLVYHTYTGGSANGNPVDVTAGAGNIKPNTTYRMVAYFHYKDEYDEDVYEEIPLPQEYITTKPFDPEGKVTIKKGSEPGSSRIYQSIPIYYDYNVVIQNFMLDAMQSTEETVYGINYRNGMNITFENVDTGKSTKVSFDQTFVKTFKEYQKPVNQTYTSKDILEPNSKYKYTITIEDYFHNEINVINYDGSFETCKSRPVADIKLESNKLEGQKFTVSLSDPDKTAKQKPGADENEYDYYFVITTKDISKIKEEDLEKGDDEEKEYDKFLNRMRDYAKTGTRVEYEDESVEVHFAYKFDKSEYWDDTKKTVIIDDYKFDIDVLDLARNYYAYIIGDYDINNNTGAVWNGSIAALPFVSASIESIGRIYVTVGMLDLSSHGVTLTYELNKARTDDYLEKILSSVEFDIVQTDDKSKIDATTKFDIYSEDTTVKDKMEKFRGYKENGDAYPYGTITLPDGTTQPETGIIGMPVDGLESKTSYTIRPYIKAQYHGKDYRMDVELSIDPTFKTFKKPARVDVKDITLAAGTLQYKVRVVDEDGAIIGYSSDTVQMQLYGLDDDKFVKTIRYKVTDNKDGEFVSEVIRGLDSTKRYKLKFIALDYNEGYTDKTRDPNHIIEPSPIEIYDITDISGTIKINGLEESGSDKIKANLSVKISDNSDVLRSKKEKYYITLEKSGEKEPISNESFNNYTVDGYTIKNNHEYIVGREKCEYTATLYIMYNNNKLILDTVTFNPKDVMYTISTAKEFVEKIKKDPTARYCITADIDLGNASGIPDPDNEGENLSSYKAISIEKTFNGELDGQGFTITYNKNTNDNSWFTNIGPKGELYNMVLELKNDASAAQTYKGIITTMNYGHIHDIYIDYKGGSVQNNYYFGLVARINAASGIIERFVVHSNPENDLFGLSVRQMCGLVVAQNMGMIRYGYVYGEEMYAATGYYSSATNLYVGGIAGQNASTGELYDVYSTVNVIIDPNKKHTYIGSVSGTGSGKLHNIYGVGDSLYANDTAVVKIVKSASDSYKFIGPVVGTNNNTNRDIYYWNKDNDKYTYSTRQTIASIENLNDYNWQKYVLGSEFDVKPVEVGFYPHVKWSTTEMPDQEYVELPKRTNAGAVDIINSEVISYGIDETTKQQTALVRFRLSNKSNLTITSIEMEGLDVVLDQNSVKTEDGFTTIEGTLSNPVKYVSQYEINKVLFINASGRNDTIDYTKSGRLKPVVNADFYRMIYTVQDWKDYVIGSPSENARLGDNLDFKDVTNPMDIIVTKEFTGKLDGGSMDIATGQTGYSLKNITIPSAQIKKMASESQDYAAVFYNLSGSIKNVTIEDFNIVTNEKDTRKTYYGFIRWSTGEVTNVHLLRTNITGTNYMGTLMAYANEGTIIENCTVNDSNLKYSEISNTNTTGRVGGIVAYATSSMIRNCYARRLLINVGDVKVANGVGGIAGEARYTQLENLYTTGEAAGRCTNVGGIVGYYYSDTYRCAVKNVISNMNLTCYQDAVGGLVGQLYLESILTERNNMSGIAFNNITCGNASADNVSYTVGYMAGATGKFAGCDCQLINGLKGQHITKSGDITDNTLMIVSYEDACRPEIYTDESMLQMDGVYFYDNVKEGYLPDLYYNSSSVKLPFQEGDPILISQTTGGINTNEITVESISYEKVKSYNVVTIVVDKPLDAEIKDVTIDKLQYFHLEGETEENLSKVTPGIKIGEDRQRAVIEIEFKGESSQEEFYDTYELTHITYTRSSNSAGKIYDADYTQEPVIIELQMFGYIDTVSRWNYYLSEERGFGDYQNYIISKDLNFKESGISYVKNVKVGRLIGDNAGAKVTLSQIYIGQDTIEDNTNLIFRCSNELSNINFNDVKITSKGRTGCGLIGTSGATIKDVNFSNIDITSKDSNAIIGVVAYQVAGKAENIIINNVNIKSTNASKNSYAGTLFGDAVFGTITNNVTVRNSSVDGNQYVGGVAGRSAGSFNNVNVIDTKVSGKSSYVGGLVGSHAVTYQSANSKYLTNCSVKGTKLEFDAEGRLKSSSMTVTSTVSASTVADSYVGGLAGYTAAYALGARSIGFTSDSDAKKNSDSILVEGVIVRASGNRVGGAYGKSSLVTNTVVKDCYVGMGDSIPTAIMSYRGGITGYDDYYLRKNRAENVVVETVNSQYVGLVSGYNGSDAYFNIVDNCVLKAKKNNSSLSPQGFGGVIGRNNGAVYYSLVKNLIIDASDSSMTAVGGIVGLHINSNIMANSVYTDPGDNGTSGDSKYYIKGYNYTGGIVGRHDKGIVYDNISNANVISANEYAGGIDGRYSTEYSLVTNANGTKKSDYSEISFRNNIFAGTVEAKKYAGGLIGSLGLVEVKGTSVAPYGGRLKSVSGKYSETSYTYYNIMLADYIKSGDENAYAFAGNHDGFEGMANTSGYTYDCDSDVNRKGQHATITMFWEGTRLISKSHKSGIMLKDIEVGDDSSAGIIDKDNSALSKDVGAYNEYLTGNYGKYRFPYYAGNLTGDTTHIYGVNSKDSSKKLGAYGKDDGDQRGFNVRLVTHDNLDTYSMYWASKFNESSSKTVKTAYANSHRFIILTKDVTTTGAPYSGVARYGSNGSGNSYLPHVRNDSAATVASIDRYLPKIQIEKEMDIPIPAAIEWDRDYRNSGLEISGARLYASGVDEITIEFGKDVREATGATFTLKYGGSNAVTSQTIDGNRVFTYYYDYGDNLTLEYSSGAGTETITKTVGELKNRIMVYDTYFYKIEESGQLTYGTQSSMTTTEAADYITIKNGEALRGTGSSKAVYDGATNNKIRDVKTGLSGVKPKSRKAKKKSYDIEATEYIKDIEEVDNLDSESAEKESKNVAAIVSKKASPFQRSIYNGVEVKTYSTFTDFGGVEKPGQFIVSALGNHAMIDDNLENVKDSYVLFTKDGEEHCVILDEDGFILDLYQGDTPEAIGAPDDFKMSGIIRMTNNMDSTAPYILVEYANGSIVGYNFMTREYLFQDLKEEHISLLDYAKQYFEGDKSELAHAFESFSGNYDLAKNARNVTKLREMVIDYEKRGKTKGNSAVASEMTKLAMDDGEEASDNTALKSGDSPEPMHDEKYIGDQEKTGNTEILESNGTSEYIGESVGNGESEASGNLGSDGNGTTGGDGESLGGVGSTQVNGEDIESGEILASGQASEEGREERYGVDPESYKNIAEATPGVDGEDGSIESLEEGEEPEFPEMKDEAEDKKKDSDSKDSIEGIEPTPTPEAGEDSSEDASSISNKEAEEGTGKGNDPYEGTLISKKNKKNDDIEEVQSDNEVTEVTTEQTLLAVYNAATGMYELIDMNEFITNPTYQSENAELGIKNLSVYSDYRAEKTETKKEKGLYLYIFATLAILAGIGGGFYFKKKSNVNV